ncbi:MAG: Abi family protein [Clostridia bacterium]|nr:Abi family protein [Clostridia bacterium]
MYTYPKRILTSTQLVSKLSSEGMIIDPTDNAEEVLSSIGYYRFKGYCFHFLDRTTHHFVPNTKFSDIVKLYRFDMDLSHLLFGYLSQIEVALRARTSQALLQAYGDALILNDPSIFLDKEKYWENQGKLSSEIVRSTDAFIKHNFDNHDGAIPIWATVEIMSFGTLSKVIKNLKVGSSSAYSILAQKYKFVSSSHGSLVTPRIDIFSSWIKAVSFLRNICAHNGRIYNRSINTNPSLVGLDRVATVPRFTGLYQIMLAMKYLRPDNDSWNTFVANFTALYNASSSIADLTRLNFPADWTTHFTV